MEEKNIDKKSQSDQPETQKELQNNSPKTVILKDEPENSIRDDDFVDTMIHFDVDDLLLLQVSVAQSDSDDAEDQDSFKYENLPMQSISDGKDESKKTAQDQQIGDSTPKLSFKKKMKKSMSDEKEKKGIYDSDLSDDTNEGPRTPKKYVGFMGFGAPKRRADGQKKIISNSKPINQLVRQNAICGTPPEDFFQLDQGYNSELDFLQNPGPSKEISDPQDGLPPVKKLKMMNLNQENEVNLNPENEETCLIPRGNSEHEICFGWNME